MMQLAPRHREKQRKAVAAGVQDLRKRGIPLLDVVTVYQELESELAEKRPYAFTRLGVRNC